MTELEPACEPSPCLFGQFGADSEADLITLARVGENPRLPLTVPSGTVRAVLSPSRNKAPSSVRCPTGRLSSTAKTFWRASIRSGAISQVAISSAMMRAHHGMGFIVVATRRCGWQRRYQSHFAGPEQLRINGVRCRVAVSSASS